MKRCTSAHTVPSFGRIPEGSLWDDDSPFVLEENAACFTDVVDDGKDELDAEIGPRPKKKAAAKRKAPARRFGDKKASDR